MSAPKFTKTIYVPCLRLKAGEYRGLHHLSHDVKDKITPRLVVPPPKDKDPELGRPLTLEEIVHLTGKRIGEYWPLREAYLDTRFLFKEFGETGSGIWLPQLFTTARNHNGKVIPVVSLHDILGSLGAAFPLVAAEGCSSKFALRVESGDIIDSQFSLHVRNALSRLGVKADECTLLLDFCDADFADAEIVAEIVRAAFEDVQEVANWGRIVFQGTNYPATNPAAAGGYTIVPRNEWRAWRSAIKFDKDTSDHLIFGDYAADCAKFEFKSGGARAIRHYRITTEDEWLVVRGAKSGRDQIVMRDVCQRIVDSGSFAGRTFSSADEYIYQTAQGWNGPGNAMVWRGINTAHHITRVVQDIGKVKGMQFASLPVSDPPKQLSIFADEDADK